MSKKKAVPQVSQPVRNGGCPTSDPSAYTPNEVRSVIALRGITIKQVADALSWSERQVKLLTLNVNISSRSRLIDFLQPEIGYIHSFQSPLSAKVPPSEEGRVARSAGRVEVSPIPGILNQSPSAKE